MECWIDSGLDPYGISFPPMEINFRDNRTSTQFVSQNGTPARMSQSKESLMRPSTINGISPKDISNFVSPVILTKDLSNCFAPCRVG